MIVAKKLIFRRTILDYALIGYLITLLVSTLFSIDPQTSWFGYYSRFNGGLFSVICYMLLYWAFVSNLNKKQSLLAIRYSLLAVAIASTIAIMEHFGIFITCGLMGFSYIEPCWVQDVQQRVFSTLGQPNWLAATVVALIPITWSQMLNFKKLNAKYLSFAFLSLVFFLTLLFTKSRSGLLAFGIEFIIFWGLIFWQSRFKYIKEFVFIFLSFSFLAFVFNPSLVARNLPETASTGPALETGGTESGTIRKYVWAGALEIFKHYPVLGTGPETFAFSFPMYRPVEHNLTSEWDYVYNKAHNEYLNYLATTGILGFCSYIFLIIMSLIQISKSQFLNSKQIPDHNPQIFKNTILAGYVSILITNFFGFSVVPTSLLFFLFPAFAVANSEECTAYSGKAKLDLSQKIGFILIISSVTYALFAIYSYWLADTHYNLARQYLVAGKIKNAETEVKKALLLNPKEALYYSTLAVAVTSPELAEKALKLNKYDLNVRKLALSVFVKAAEKDIKYMELVEKTLIEGLKLSPINPKGYMQMAVFYSESDFSKSEQLFLKAIDLKNNYKDARYNLAKLYLKKKEYKKAKEQLEYILNFIDPNDELTKKYLGEFN